MAEFGSLTMNFPELRTRLDFGEFHEGLAGNYVEVWLNLSEDFNEERRAHTKRYEVFERRRDALVEGIESGRLKGKELDVARIELIALVEEMAVATAGIYARLWGCSVEEYRALVQTEGAQRLMAWLYERSWEMVADYRAARTKVRSD